MLLHRRSIGNGIKRKGQRYMNIKLSKKLLRDIKKDYVSLEYVLREVLPSVRTIHTREIPPMTINDGKEMVDIPEDIAVEIARLFPSDWGIDDCCEYLLIFGVLMEV